MTNKNDEINGEYSDSDFDINNPALLAEAADEIDPDVDADEFPPPPPDGIYFVNWDVSESAPEKQFTVKQDSKGKAFLMVKLVGTIVDCKDQSVPERLWTGRKVFTMINTITFQSKTSGFGDWLKSVGRKRAVELAARAANKSEQLKAYQDAAVNALIEGAQGWATLCWEGSYRFESSEGTSYLRPRGKYVNGEKIAKDHPVQRFSNMKAFPTNDKGERIPKALVIDPEDGNEYEVVAQLTVKKYIPNREG